MLVELSGFEITVIYQCPHCGCEHFLTVEEAKTPHFKVVCHCKNSFTIQELTDVHINYSYDKTREQCLAIDILKNYGYDNAKELVLNCTITNDTAKIVADVLRSIK